MGSPGAGQLAIPSFGDPDPYFKATVAHLSDLRQRMNPGSMLMRVAAIALAGRSGAARRAADRLLVFTKTAGYRHDSDSGGRRAIRGPPRVTASPSITWRTPGCSARMSSPPSKRSPSSTRPATSSRRAAAGVRGFRRRGRRLAWPPLRGRHGLRLAVVRQARRRVVQRVICPVCKPGGALLPSPPRGLAERMASDGRVLQFPQPPGRRGRRDREARREHL